MYTLIVVFALLGQPETQMSLHSVSQESCRIESMAIEPVFRNMGVVQYYTQCVKNSNED